MTWSWKDEARLWGAEILKQIFGLSERTAFTLVGLKSLWHHIKAERAAMTRALWFSVCRFYGWRCLRCGLVNWQNKELGKARIEVDHVQSLYHWGKTVWNNLQTLCKPCNQWKGVRDIDYRA